VVERRLRGARYRFGLRGDAEGWSASDAKPPARVWTEAARDGEERNRSRGATFQAGKIGFQARAFPLAHSARRPRGRLSEEADV